MYCQQFTDRKQNCNKCTMYVMYVILLVIRFLHNSKMQVQKSRPQIFSNATTWYCTCAVNKYYILIEYMYILVGIRPVLNIQTVVIYSLSYISLSPSSVFLILLSFLLVLYLHSVVGNCAFKIEVMHKPLFDCCIAICTPIYVRQSKCI